MALLAEQTGEFASATVPLVDRRAVREPAGRLAAAVEAIHASRFHPGVLVVDALLIGAVTAWVSSVPMALAVLALVPMGAATGLYRRRSCFETQGVSWHVRAILLPAALGAAVLALTRPAGVSQAGALGAWLLAAAILVAARAGLWFAIAVRRRRGLGLQPALVSGHPQAVELLRRRVNAYPECGIRIVAGHSPLEGADQRDPVHRPGPPPGIEPKRALDLIDRREVSHVLLVSAGGDRGTYDQLVHRGEGLGIDYSLVVPLAALSGQPFRHRLGDLGILPLGRVNYSSRPMPGKRAFDVVMSSALLVLLAPVLGIVALAVALADRGPVLYGQLRVGRGGRLFRMLKFRSMVVGADRRLAAHQEGNVGTGLLFKLADDPRVTRVGAVLRRLSLDELPQLCNVLKGDMSLVGPRPLPVSPHDFDEVAAKRHSVRPGISGPWQVHGGNALTYDDMVALDLAYISSWSLRTDLWLLVRTVPALLVRRAPC